MAEWEVNDEMTAALMNAKNVYRAAAEPGTKYDGQVWVCTSSDPPLVKVYDTTNTQWMEYHAVYYETQTGAWDDPATTPVTNGTLVILYNSTQTGTRLYGYSNAAWVNLGGTLAQVYPEGDVEADGVTAVGPTSLADGFTSVLTHAGQSYIMKQINVNPSISGSTITAFGGACISVLSADDVAHIRLFIGGTEVDSETVIQGYENVSLRGFKDNMEDTSTAVYIDIEKITDGSAVSGHIIYHAGAATASVTVIT